jgi:hypothetical protein
MDCQGQCSQYGHRVLRRISHGWTLLQRGQEARYLQRALNTKVKVKTDLIRDNHRFSIYNDDYAYYRVDVPN